MERAALTALGWTATDLAALQPPPRPGTGTSSSAAPQTVPVAATGSDVVFHHASTPATNGSGMRGARARVRILRRWAFSSQAKRMTTAIAVEEAGATTFRIVCKGAPEVVLALLAAGERSDTRSHAFQETYSALTCTGARVLALAIRPLTATHLAEWGAGLPAPSGATLSCAQARKALRGVKRAQVESDFTFAGFLVLASPLKTDTLRTVRELQASSHRVVMITGDAPMTALAVAAQTNIVSVPRSLTLAAGVATSERANAWILEVDPAAAPLASGGSWQASLRWAQVPLPSLDAPTNAAGDVELTAPAVSGSDGQQESAALRAAASAAQRSVREAVRALQTELGGGGGGAGMTWRPQHVPFAWDDAAAMPPAGTVVCVTGAALATLRRAAGLHLMSTDQLSRVTRWAALTSCVFARMSPDDKEAVVVAINSSHVPLPGEAAAARRQHFTLMCGDGTNDVAALKQSHVGVSIISNPVLERKYDLMRMRESQAKRTASQNKAAAQIANMRRLGWVSEAQLATMEAQMMEQARAADAARERAGGGDLDEDNEELEALLKAERSTAAPAPSPAPAPAQVAGAPAAAASAAPKDELKARLEALQGELMAGGLAGDEGMNVGLGDASIASPFTSKFPSPLACVEILRQGRCTLVATQQVYRILATNSLVLSYMLSVLYLHGVKSGDAQATAAGLLVTACFLFTSWARPMRRLSQERPRTSVFNWPLVLGVLGQFAIHVGTMALAVHWCMPSFTADKARIEEDIVAKLAALNATQALPPLVSSLAAATPTPTPLPTVAPVAVGGVGGGDEFSFGAAPMPAPAVEAAIDMAHSVALSAASQVTVTSSWLSSLLGLEESVQIGTGNVDGDGNGTFDPVAEREKRSSGPTS